MACQGSINGRKPMCALTNMKSLRVVAMVCKVGIHPLLPRSSHSPNRVIACFDNSPRHLFNARLDAQSAIASRYKAFSFLQAGFSFYPCISGCQLSLLPSVQGRHQQPNHLLAEHTYIFPLIKQVTPSQPCHHVFLLPCRKLLPLRGSRLLAHVRHKPTHPRHIRRRPTHPMGTLPGHASDDSAQHSHAPLYPLPRCAYRRLPAELSPAAVAFRCNIVATWNRSVHRLPTRSPVRREAAAHAVILSISRDPASPQPTIGGVATVAGTATAIPSTAIPAAYRPVTTGTAGI